MAVAPGANFSAMGLGGPGSAPNYRASTAPLPGVMQGRAPWLPQGTALPGLTPPGGAAPGAVPWHVQLSQQQATAGNEQAAEMARQKALADALKQKQSQSDIPDWVDIPYRWKQAQEEAQGIVDKDPTAVDLWESQGMDQDAVVRGLYRGLNTRTREDD